MKSTTKRGVRLRRPEDVRRFLSRVINQTVNGEIETDICRATTYACNVLLKSMEVSDLEQRLSKLEESIIGKG